MSDDALVKSWSAWDLMSNQQIRKIVAEFVKQIQSKASVEGWKFEQRRTEIRVAIRRILRKFGYPPDLQAAAVKTVVEQAEVLAMEFAGRVLAAA
jgi:type I restriction enzyme R subunit